MNTQHLILSPTGRPLYKVGDICLPGFPKPYRGFMVSIEWMNEGRECEPVMCIWSPQSMDGGVFAICLSSIGKYADPSGDPTPLAFLECCRALPTLGCMQIDIECHRLLDVILQFTPDLIRCPPQPTDMRLAEASEALLEITQQTTDGKTLAEHVI